MKSNSLKKLLSVLLVAALVCACIPTLGGSKAKAQEAAPVADALTAGDEIYPMIILPGINHSVSYLANEDGTPAKNADGKELSGGILIIDSAGLAGKLIKKLLLPLLTSLFFQFDNGLSKAAYDVVCDLFSLQSCDKQGNQLHNLATESYDYPISEMEAETKKWFYNMLPIGKVADRIGEDNIYLCTFPLVGNPMDSAKKFSDYIDFVKEQTGAEKVNIATVSLGGTILTAYAEIAEDWSDINRIVNVVSCLDGTDFVADFFDRKWNLEDSYLYRDYLRNIMLASNGSETLGCVLNAAVRLFSKKTVYALLTGAFDGVLDALLVNNPMFWAMLPGARYTTLADRYISGSDYAVLRAKTDEFQQARLHLKANLAEAYAQGVEIFNICGSDLTYDDGDYNFLGIVASTATCNCDGVVPVYSTSLGATTVPTGTEFSADYLASHDSKYISTYKSVDASTCAFPDRVWFFQKQHHEVGRDDVVIELLARIADGTIDDINSDPLFPQFNFTRNTRAISKWLKSDSEKVFENADGKYSEKDIATVRTAYDAAMQYLNDYTLTEDSLDESQKVMMDLANALTAVGARPREGLSDGEKFLESTAKKADDTLFNVVGGNGFLDFTRIGDLFTFIFGLFKPA